MNSTGIKSLLENANSVLTTKYGHELTKNYLNVLVENDEFEIYLESLKEGLSYEEQAIFESIARNTRETMIMETTTTASWQPYQQLVMPLLRFVFPRLIAKEAVTVSPIDAPEVVKYFIRAVVTSFNGVQTDLPSPGTTLSQGPNSPVTMEIDLSSNPSASVSLLEAASVPDPSLVILQRSVFVSKAVTVDSSTGDEIEIDINQKLDPITGKGSFNVQYNTSGGTVNDTILISVDFESGYVTVSSISGETKKVIVTGSVSLETNNYIPTTELKLQKIPLNAVTRSLAAKWSIEEMQDVKALLDLDYQSEIISIIGQKIASDIDIEIINDILNEVTYVNPSSVFSFTKTPPTTYAFGEKHWIEDTFVPLLTQVSGKIYNDTNIGEANFIMANPQDAALIQSLDTFRYSGDTTGGSMLYGYGAMIGTVQGGIKVLSSANVPKGKMIVGLKPQEEKYACYMYAPYIPITVVPYPLSDNPTVTFKSRYAKAMIRREGYAVIEIV